MILREDSFFNAYVCYSHIFLHSISDVFHPPQPRNPGFLHPTNGNNKNQGFTKSSRQTVDSPILRSLLGKNLWR